MSNKNEFYQLLVSQVKTLIAGENDMIANMANISSALYHQMEAVNWVGFYLFKEEQLVLGPFHGQPACIRIPLGKGVCGTAAQSQTIQRVDDVHAFAGHIACDAASNSEIVLPLVINNQLIGVFDIDSPEFARFDDIDQHGLTQIVDCLLGQIKS